MCKVYNRLQQALAAHNPRSPKKGRKCTSSAFVRLTGKRRGIITTVYDLLLRPIAQIDELGYRIAFAYDVLGNVTETTGALGWVHMALYDFQGSRYLEIDPSVAVPATSTTRSVGSTPSRMP